MNWLYKAATASLLLLMLVTASYSAAYTSKTSKLKNSMEITGNLVVDGNETITGTTLATGINTFTAVPVFPVGGITLSGTNFNGTLQETASLGQATTYSLPDPGAASATAIVTTGNANGQVSKARVFNVPILTVPTVAGTTYTVDIAMGRACKITQISIGAHVKPTVATTVTISGGGNTLLSTANIDASTAIVSPDVSVPLTLTATSANLSLTATQMITITWVAAGSGTQATAPVVSVEALTTDY